MPSGAPRTGSEHRTGAGGTTFEVRVPQGPNGPPVGNVCPLETSPWPGTSWLLRASCLALVAFLILDAYEINVVLPWFDIPNVIGHGVAVVGLIGVGVLRRHQLGGESRVWAPCWSLGVTSDGQVSDLRDR